MKSFVFILFLTSFSAFAENNIKNLAALNFLSVDNFDNNQKNCSLTKEESQAMLNLIHVKYDELGKSINLSKNSKNILNCKKECTCDLYKTVINNNPEIKDSKKYSLILEKKVLNEKEKLSCLKKSKILCKSRFFKKMKNELADFLPAESAK